MADKLNIDKYKNALAYLVGKCGNEKLGIMKLNKIFYYLDFISYRDRGVAVTDETYLHLPKGPFASSLQDVVIPLAEKENIIEQKEDISEKFGKRNRFKALKKPDMSLFDDYEKNLLEYLCVTFKDWTTDQMVAQTHTEAPWVFSKPSKSLDYKNADDIEFFAAK